MEYLCTLDLSVFVKSGYLQAFFICQRITAGCHYYTSRRFVTLHYKGKKSPIRGRVIFSDMKLRSGELYSQDLYEESLNRFIGQGVYASTSIEFKKKLRPDGTVLTVPDTVRSLTRDGQERPAEGRGYPFRAGVRQGGV